MIKDKKVSTLRLFIVSWSFIWSINKNHLLQTWKIFDIYIYMYIASKDFFTKKKKKSKKKENFLKNKKKKVMLLWPYPFWAVAPFFFTFISLITNFVPLLRVREVFVIIHYIFLRKPPFIRFFAYTHFIRSVCHRL